MTSLRASRSPLGFVGAGAGKEAGCDVDEGVVELELLVPIDDDDDDE